MKVQRFLLIAILVCLIFSLVATLASYNIYYADPYVVDVARLHRGWPLYWMIESWPVSNPPPLYAIFRSFYFQPLNFLIDIIFWAVVFQLPSVTLLLLKENKKHSQSACFHRHLKQH